MYNNHVQYEVFLKSFCINVQRTLIQRIFKLYDFISEYVFDIALFTSIGQILENENKIRELGKH